MNRQCAVELNDIGRSLLEVGRNDAARECFKDAIANMQSAIRGQSLRKEDAKNAFESMDSNPSILVARQQLAQARQNAQGRRSDPTRRSIIKGLDSEFAGGSSSILEYRESASLHHPTLEGDDQKSAMLILYNFALAHHLLGTERCDAGLLRKALAIYDMALSLLDGIMGTDAASSQLLTFAAAAIHNMGHIYCLLGNFDAARDCFEDLSSLCDEQTASEEDAWNHFWCSTLFMKPSSNAPAA